MWGFLYSNNFGPLADIFASFGRQAPDFLSSSLIFYGLLNIVTWQWAGYYMIIIYAALQGIDPDPLRGGAHRRRIPVADRPADQDPAGHPGPPADPGVRPHRHPAVLQRAEDPAAAGGRLHPQRLHAQHVRRISRPSRWRTTTTVRRSRSRWAPSSSSASTSSCSPPASEGASSHDRHARRSHGHRSDTGRCLRAEAVSSSAAASR